MKTLLIILLLCPFTLWACKPGPLVQCLSADVTVHPEKLRRLLTETEQYQKYLTVNLVVPSQASSCFDNGFALYYLGMLRERLGKKGFSCPEQMSFIRDQVLRLIDPNSSENKSLKSTTDRVKMKKLRDSVQKALTEAFPLSRP